MNVPESLSEWEAQRPAIRTTLWRLLGDLPPLFTPDVQIVTTLSASTSRSRRSRSRMGRGHRFRPCAGATPGAAPTPAVLYSHFHGGHYHIGKDEVFLDRVSVPPLGPALAEAGFIVLAIDAYSFGERQTQGPAGSREVGADTEMALYKKLLWEGSTLWGMIVRDDLLALNYLCARPDVDPARLVATGISLGGSRTTWVSALDDRIALTVPVAQMTRYRDFVEAGSLNGHRITSRAGSAHRRDRYGASRQPVAPRAQIILIGDSDPPRQPAACGRWKRSRAKFIRSTEPRTGSGGHLRRGRAYLHARDVRRPDGWPAALCVAMIHTGCPFFLPGRRAAGWQVTGYINLVMGLFNSPDETGVSYRLE